MNRRQLFGRLFGALFGSVAGTKLIAEGKTASRSKQQVTYPFTTVTTYYTSDKLTECVTPCGPVTTYVYHVRDLRFTHFARRARNSEESGLPVNERIARRTDTRAVPPSPSPVCAILTGVPESPADHRRGATGS
jgi:hypothetical protein